MNAIVFRSYLYSQSLNSPYRSTTRGVHFCEIGKNLFFRRQAHPILQLAVVSQHIRFFRFSRCFAMASKPIQCKAAVVWKACDPVSIEVVEVAAPAEDEVRVKVANVGICHSDIVFQRHLVPFVKFPCVMGHEGSGVVESVGKDVTSLKPGDHVILLWNFRCGKCRGCLNPHGNICDALKPQMMNYSLKGTEYNRFSLKGQRLFQVMSVGAFSEYTVVHEKAALKINPEVALHRAALFGCCVPTGYGAAKYDAKVLPGSSVVVWGLGAVGLCAVLGSRGCKAGKIIGVDINKDKFAIGKKLGCTDVINPLELTKPISAVITEMTGGGADCVIVCVGKEEVMEEAVECCHPGVGQCIIIGIAENSRNLSVDPKHLILGRSLRGSWMGRTRTEDLSELVNMHNEGAIPVDDLITGRIKIEQLNEGLKLLEQGKSIRTVVDM